MTDSTPRRLRRFGAATLAVATASAVSLITLAVPAAADASVYVAIGGITSGACGDSIENACATIDQGLSMANSGGTIIVMPGTYTEQNRIFSPATITGSPSADGDVIVQGPPDQTDPTFDIVGEGSFSVTLKNMTILAGPDADTAVSVGYGQYAKLDSVTVSAGAAEGEQNQHAGVHVDQGTVSLTDSAVTGSDVGIMVDQGSAESTDTTLSGNGIGLMVSDGHATVHGGVVRDNAVAGLMAIGVPEGQDLPALAIEGTSISGNGGELSLFGAGVTALTSTVTATDVTVTDNTPFGIGVIGSRLTLTDSAVRNSAEVTVDGHASGGAGIYGLDSGDLTTPGPSQITVQRSEISGNEYGMLLSGMDGIVDRSTVAGNGGIGIGTMVSAPVEGADAAPGGRLVVTRSTIADNEGTVPGDIGALSGGDGSEPGPAISGIAAGPGTQVVLAGSVVASPSEAPACGAFTTGEADGAEATFTDGGYSVDSDDSCGLSAATSRAGVEPQVEDLADNPGPASDTSPMRTMLPSLSSPALDLIPADATFTLPEWASSELGAVSASCGPDATDQVGTVRPQGKACDAGAAERVILPLDVTTTSLPGGMTGVDYGTRMLHATGWYGGPYFWEIVDGALPGGLKLNQQTGEITGRPTESGTFSFTVKASMPGDPDTATLTITVAAAPVTTVTTTATVTVTAPVTQTATGPTSGTATGPAQTTGTVTATVTETVTVTPTLTGTSTSGTSTTGTSPTGTVTGDTPASDPAEPTDGAAGDGTDASTPGTPDPDQANTAAGSGSDTAVVTVPPSGDDDAGGELANTGVDARPGLVLGIGALLLGIGLLTGARPRRGARRH